MIRRCQPQDDDSGQWHAGFLSVGEIGMAEEQLLTDETRRFDRNAIAIGEKKMFSFGKRRQPTVRPAKAGEVMSSKRFVVQPERPVRFQFAHHAA